MAANFITRASICSPRKSWTSWFRPQPENRPAKDLLADIFEQIGYQQENPGLRNSFLAGAYELRTGIPQGEIASSAPAPT